MACRFQGVTVTVMQKYSTTQIALGGPKYLRVDLRKTRYLWCGSHVGPLGDVSGVLNCVHMILFLAKASPNDAKGLSRIPGMAGKCYEVRPLKLTSSAIWTRATK